MSAGVFPEFGFEWHPHPDEMRWAEPLLVLAQERGKKICVLKEPSTPHRYKRQRLFKNTPDVAKVQQWVNQAKSKFLIVAVGKDEVLKGSIEGIDVDLKDRLTLPEFMAVCQTADLIATQESHLVPIAHAFKKPVEFLYYEKDKAAKWQRLNPNPT